MLDVWPGNYSSVIIESAEMHEKCFITIPDPSMNLGPELNHRSIRASR